MESTAADEALNLGAVAFVLALIPAKLLAGLVAPRVERLLALNAGCHALSASVRLVAGPAAILPRRRGPVKEEGFAAELALTGRRRDLANPVDRDFGSSRFLLPLVRFSTDYLGDLVVINPCHSVQAVKDELEHVVYVAALTGRIEELGRHPEVVFAVRFIFWRHRVQEGFSYGLLSVMSLLRRVGEGSTALLSEPRPRLGNWFAGDYEACDGLGGCVMFCRVDHCHRFSLF